MNGNTAEHALVFRLRANLSAAGIPTTDADIQEIIERGYMHTVAAFERLATAAPADALPDYLAARTVVLQTDETGILAAPAAPQRHVRYPTPSGLPAGSDSTARAHFAALAEIAEEIRSRSVSPVELTHAALAAIEATDPLLNAFQCVLADAALAAARVAESEIAQGIYRGPLHGIPVAAKDLFAMRGTITTAGSTILDHWETDFDAAAVERLRDAGAVIVGKTRLSEFAYSPGSNNAHYGATANPWNPDHDTGGSSSGSGAAVAAGLVYAALGTDTGGSIRIPASLCGIVGLKPTFGRCSLFGAVSLSWSLDHVGPLARTVHDAAVLLQALAGHDPRDTRTRTQSEWLYQPGAIDSGVRGMRIGVLQADGSGAPLATDAALAAWHAGLRALETAGARLVPVDLPELETVRSVNSAILVLEAAAFHIQHLRTRLLDYGTFPRHRILHAFAYGPLALIQAQQLRTTARRQLQSLWQRIDLLSTPAMPFAAPRKGVPASTAFTAPFNCLGWPAISMPVGLSAENLPFGLQLIGRRWDEDTVLRAARTLELTRPWRAP